MAELWFRSARYSWGGGRDRRQVTDISLRHEENSQLVWALPGELAVCLMSWEITSTWVNRVIWISCKLLPGLGQSGHGSSWPLKGGCCPTGGSHSSLRTLASQNENGNDETHPCEQCPMGWPSSWKSVLADVHSEGKCDLSFQVALPRLLPQLWLVVWFTLRLLYLNSNVVI